MRYLLCFILIGVASSAWAADSKCKRTVEETATVSVAFNGYADTLQEAKAKYDARIKEISDLLTKQNVAGAEIQGSSGNLYSSNSTSSASAYEFGGNVNYTAKTAQDAIRLADALKADRKVQVTVGSITNYVGNCDTPAAKPGE